jgi:hypothetical protein
MTLATTLTVPTPSTIHAITIGLGDFDAVSLIQHGYMFVDHSMYKFHYYTSYNKPQDTLHFDLMNNDRINIGHVPYALHWEDDTPPPQIRAVVSLTVSLNNKLDNPTKHALTAAEQYYTEGNSSWTVHDETLSGSLHIPDDDDVEDDEDTDVSTTDLWTWLSDPANGERAKFLMLTSAPGYEIPVQTQFMPSTALNEFENLDPTDWDFVNVLDASLCHIASFRIDCGDVRDDVDDLNAPNWHMMTELYEPSDQ